VRFRVRSPAGTLVSGLALVAVALALAGFALASLSPTWATAEPLHMLDLVRPHLVALLAAAAAGWAASGRRARAGLAGAAALAGLAGMPEAFLSPPREAGPDCAPLTVATANAYQANAELERLGEALAAADADMLVVAEMTAAMAPLAARLGELYPWRTGAAVETCAAWRCLGLWSRLPFAAQAPARSGMHPRHLLTAVQATPGTALQVLAIHLGFPEMLEDYRPVPATARFRDDLAPPAVVLGDFNAPPWSGAVRRIGEATGTRAIPGYRPTWVGGGATPLRLPAALGLSLDQILVSPGVEVRGVSSFALPGSDHLGVRAELCLPR